MSAFEKALNEPGQGLARALTESGAVPGYVAEAAVRALSERLFFDTLQWTNGVFAVTRSTRPPTCPRKVDRPTGGMLLEALRRLPAPAVPAQLSSRPGRGRCSRPTSSFATRRFSVSAEEAEVLGKVDGAMTVEQIHRDQRSSRGSRPRVSFSSWRRGGPSRRAACPRSPVPERRDRGSAAAARVAEQNELQREVVWNTYRRLDWATHYDLLGVEPEDAARPRERAPRARAHVPPRPSSQVASRGRPRGPRGAVRPRPDAERAFRTPEARAAYDRTLEVSADTVALPGTAPTLEVQKEIARKNYTRAKVLYEEEDFYPAYEMTRQAVEFDPGQKEYWVLLSRIQRKNPKWVQACHRDDAARRQVHAGKRRALVGARGGLPAGAERVGAHEGPQGGHAAGPREPPGAGALAEITQRRAGDERTSPALRHGARPVGRGGPQLLRRAPRLRSDRAVLPRGLSRRDRPSARFDPALGVAAVLFLLEFFADKIPGLDHFWHLLHSFVRPVVGALVALAVVQPEGRPS